MKAEIVDLILASLWLVVALVFFYFENVEPFFLFAGIGLLYVCKAVWYMERRMWLEGE